MARTTVPDATWLFEGRDPRTTDRRVMARQGEQSEHWWTAVFSLLLLHLCAQSEPATIPLRRYHRSNDKETYPLTGSLDYHPLSLRSLLVEARLSAAVAKDLFQVPDWPQEFERLEVDIALSIPQHNRIVLIENKTVRGSANSLERYAAVADYLRKKGHCAHLHVLISCGHPNNDIWNTIEREGLEIIIWEDVLRLLHSTEFFRGIFHDELPDYFAHCPQ